MTTHKTESKMSKAFKYFVKYILPFIAGVSMIISTMAAQYRKILREELKPITDYIVVDYSYDLDSVFNKLQSNPHDLHAEDLEKLLVQYGLFDEEMIKTHSFEEKITSIRKVYQQRIGG